MRAGKSEGKRDSIHLRQLIRKQVKSVQTVTAGYTFLEFVFPLFEQCIKSSQKKCMVALGVHDSKLKIRRIYGDSVIRKTLLLR